MTEEEFENLLEQVESIITKKRFCKAISAGERLSVTLRFLVTGV